jgi:hypothetical protein
MVDRVAFDTFAERKVQEASASRIQTLTTIVDRRAATCRDAGLSSAPAGRSSTIARS